jgi:hypothetical protein
MPDDVFQDLKKVWVCNQQLRISRLQAGSTDKKFAGKGGKKKGKS